VFVNRIFKEILGSEPAPLYPQLFELVTLFPGPVEEGEGLPTLPAFFFDFPSLGILT